MGKYNKPEIILTLFNSLIKMYKNTLGDRKHNITNKLENIYWAERLVLLLVKLAWKLSLKKY